MPTSNLLCSASSCRCANSRAACAAWTRFDVVLHLRRRVGDVGGDLQLDLPQLRLDLVQLHARPRHGRFLRAGAERVDDVQRDVPGRIVAAEAACSARRRSRRESSSVTTRLMPGPDADELRAALPDQAVARRRRRPGAASGCAGYFSVTSLICRFFLACARSVRASSARRTAAVDVDRLGPEIGPVGRIELARSSWDPGCRRRSAA